MQGGRKFRVWLGGSHQLGEVGSVLPQERVDEGGVAGATNARRGWRREVLSVD